MLLRSQYLFHEKNDSVFLIRLVNVNSHIPAHLSGHASISLHKIKWETRRLFYFVSLKQQSEVIWHFFNIFKKIYAKIFPIKFCRYVCNFISSIFPHVVIHFFGKILNKIRKVNSLYFFILNSHWHKFKSLEKAKKFLISLKKIQTWHEHIHSIFLMYLFICASFSEFLHGIDYYCYYYE